MAKKYLSMEEAASHVGVDAEELNRLREAGEIRGFADRGTWKFRPEDVEELGRRRQADSSPSVPIIDDEAGPGSSVVFDDADTEGSSVLLGEEDDLGQQPTIIRKEDSGVITDDSASDSDVRLVLDESLTADSDPDVAAQGNDSDSDVRLVDDSPKSGDSDSDVKLVGDSASDDSDSDVKLVEEDEEGPIRIADDSDSDVKLVSDASQSDILPDAPAAAGPGSDSDVKLIGPDATTDSDISLAPEEDVALSAESGISLEQPVDSGIALEGAVDSGISLEAEDSGIALAAEEDSGVALGSPTDSGIALEALNAPAKGGADLDETQFEVEAFDDSEFELKSGETGTGSDTGVIVFEDEDDVDEHGATLVKSKAQTPSDEFEFDDDLEVAEDVIGEDDELDDMDVFDASDEDFAESFETGESHAEFISPGGAVAAPMPQEWGTGTFVGLLLATLLMAVCAMVMFDFVRSIWSWNEPSGFTGALMKAFGGLFKK